MIRLGVVKLILGVKFASDPVPNILNHLTRRRGCVLCGLHKGREKGAEKKRGRHYEEIWKPGELCQAAQR